ncbi:hypothetical protein JCM24511_06530 [Saitozyma sp. JCM 24511]|nr:hypothetical protein JCM24511_06530 [Saitozyma sp. JCM 24511]
MPPKRSDLHHVTFHFFKSAVLLSIPASTTLTALKSQLLPALQPLSQTIPVSVPSSSDAIRLYEDNTTEGAPTALRCIEEEKGAGGRSVAQMGWGRWKSVYVSFRDENGSFSDPVYTVPDVEDEEPVEE